MNLSLVFPLYNESRRVSILEGGLFDFIKGCRGLEHEIILVNDGSSDDTLSKIRSIRRHLLEFGAEALKDVVIVDLKPNRGKGGALREGVLCARGEWVLTLDADMSAGPLQVLSWNDKGWLNIFKDPPAGDCVFVGSRNHPDSVVSSKEGRKFMGRAFNLFVRVINNIDIHDTQCGFKLYPIGIAKAVFGALTDFGWAHDVELLKRAANAGCKLVELPIEWHLVGDNKINPVADAFPMFLSLLKLKYKAIKGELR